MVAWKAAAFAIKRWELGSQYYCPTCDYNPDNDKHRDKANGCPRCPLMELFDGIRIKGVERLIKEFPVGWTLDSVTHLHSIVSATYHENNNTIDDRWSFTFAELARIVEQEEAKVKWSEEWTSWKKMKAT